MAYTLKPSTAVRCAGAQRLSNSNGVAILRAHSARPSFSSMRTSATSGQAPGQAPSPSPAKESPKPASAPKAASAPKPAPSAPKPAASAPKPAASAPKPAASASKPAVLAPRPKGPTYVDPWLSVVEAEKTGATLEVKVKAVNKGGLIVVIGELKGFIPYNQLAVPPMRMPQEDTDMSYLVGQKLNTKIVSVDNTLKTFIVSERKVQQSEAMRNLKVGSTRKAVVLSVEDYGAFVELVDHPNVTGLIHKTELSWDSFTSVASIIKKGQVISVKVIDLEAAKCRLGLSLKQTQPDPIKMTLDKVEWRPTQSVPPEIQQLLERLKKQAGVEDVTVGRQAVEAHIASQELVVYLAKDDAANVDGFGIVARLGSVLQELRIVTKMTRDEGRSLIAQAVKI